MSFILQFFKKEVSHFKKLSQESQALLISFALEGIADPMLFMFVDAFLWRRSHSLELVAMYTVSFVIGIPFGFYMNGIFLKKYPPKTMYLIGCILQGVIVSSLIFFSSITIVSLIIFGVIFGIGVGVYWANRNLLSLRATHNDNRIYFTSVESSTGIFIGIFAPFLIGWTISLGDTTHWYTSTQAYELLSLGAIGILTASGLVLRNTHIQLAPIKEIFLPKSGKIWNLYRLYSIVEGCTRGINLFVPTLLVLSFVGIEGVLGTVQSFAAILSALVIYTVGKKLSPRHRVMLMTASFLINLLSTGSVALLFSVFGVLLFSGLAAIEAPIAWVGISSMYQDTIDTEEKNSPYGHYSYVFDNELFLNIGRIVSIVLFLYILLLFKQHTTLRFSPLFFIILEIPLIILTKIIDKQNLTHN